MSHPTPSAAARGAEPSGRSKGPGGCWLAVVDVRLGREDVHTVPYVPSAASEGHAGVVRIESWSGASGQVRVVAVDDAGQRVEAGRLTLEALAAIEFETGAMESGDADRRAQRSTRSHPGGSCGS